jgi:hypothetical protein
VSSSSGAQVNHATCEFSAFTSPRTAKKLTISMSDEVYRVLYAVIGRRRISRFLEDLARPHVTGKRMEAEYLTMARDEAREREAGGWCGDR